MFQTSIRRPLTRGSRLSAFTDTRATAHKRHYDYQFTRSATQTIKWDKSALEEPSFKWSFQPRFRSEAMTHRRNQRTWQVQAIDNAHRRHILNEPKTAYLWECWDRFDLTGMPFIRTGTLPWTSHTDKDNGSLRKITDTKHKYFECAVHVRSTCRISFLHGLLQEYIEARKLCAELKDQRFPVIFQSLEKQAHLTYIVGRVELERKREYRVLAWYMLSIAAALGQLDAALLLHKLERVDSSCALYAEQRAVITAAATQRIDWRAMVAHCDHLFVAANRGGKRGRLRPDELEQCLGMLEAAMSLTSPTRELFVQRTVPEDRLDVDALEGFEPPYTLLLAITSAEMAAGNTSARVVELHEKAARQGGIVYNDPAAAWQYVALQLSLDKECDDEWVQCIKLAATNGNPEACFQLARYHLYSERWHPSTASVVLAEKGGENLKRSADEELAIHNEIMARKDERQLESQEGMYWMELAAQLNMHSAAKMLNRYCIAAFLLRQNAFLDEGRAMLIKAKQELKNCVDEETALKRAAARLDEYLEYWDKKLVHQILEPEMIARLLDETQKF